MAGWPSRQSCSLVPHRSLPLSVLEGHLLMYRMRAPFHELGERLTTPFAFDNPAAHIE
jgi:hypothetical protein